MVVVCTFPRPDSESISPVAAASSFASKSTAPSYLAKRPEDMGNPDAGFSCGSI